MQWLSWSSILGAVVAMGFATPVGGEARKPETSRSCGLDALSASPRARQAGVIELPRSRIARAKPAPRGYVLELRGGGEAFRDAAEWVTLERRCCGFFEFGVEWPSVGAPRVRPEGPAGARELIAQELRLERR